MGRVEDQPEPSSLNFVVSFDDGSIFTLPKRWEDAFLDEYGFNASTYPELGERLAFVTGKYIEHEAFPSKYDGDKREAKRGLPEEEDSDEKYDDPDFYGEHWRNWEDGKFTGWTNRIITAPPTSAEVAERAMYMSLRGLIMQKALLDHAEEEGKPAILVVNPKSFLRELGAQMETDLGEL